MRFVETHAFTRRVAEMLSEADYAALQEALLRRPRQGDLIRETGGIRKLRWGEAGRGKRGGLRVIYYWHAGHDLFLMLFIYRKSNQGDLTADQRRALATIVQEEFR